MMPPGGQPDRPASDPFEFWAHAAIVPMLMLVAAALAVTSLVGDSITFDETSHLTAGFSYLKTGDFRLAPDHPPLAKLWCAWPLLLMDVGWPFGDDPDWVRPAVFLLGRKWLFKLNDGQHLMVVGRCMMVVVLLGACLATYVLGRRLFGSAAGLVALALAALSPEMLAHGRLVTTDVPITLLLVLSALAFAWLMERLTWLRLLAAAVCLTAASLTKFTWFMVLPGLAVMGLVAVLRARPLGVCVLPGRRYELCRRLSRLGGVAGAGLLLAGLVWAGIWLCYGWRFDILAPPPAANPPASSSAAAERYEWTRRGVTDYWQELLYYPDGRPRPGVVNGVSRRLLDARLLPEAYLLGLVSIVQAVEERPAYLLGMRSDSGWPHYFPVAFAVKTPVATMVLLVAGVLAVARGRVAWRGGLLQAGLLVFAGGYAAHLAWSGFNIGHRHLLPLYPLVYVYAGAAVGWISSRAGRVLVIGCLFWLLSANLWIHPHYLAYFNELAGGPSRGHHYLADSNIDWGQDLLRLADYARAHPDEPLKLSYFGSAVPTAYVQCGSLPSYLDFRPRAELTAGTYVVSVNQLLGLYDVRLRDEWEGARSGLELPDDPDRRAIRLITRLRYRPPDERIGYSLFLYRLSDADVRVLTRP